MLYLHKQGYDVEIDRRNQTLPKKIRENQLSQWNYILVCGEEEVKSGTVDVRSREDARLGKMRVDELHKYFQSLMPLESEKSKNLYSKAWNPADYPIVSNVG